MNRKQKRDELFATLGVTDQLRECSRLENWALAYVAAAESAGEDLNLEHVDYSPLAGTIRLVCDVWPYCSWSSWLSWQRYDGPRRRGPWWLAHFEMPGQWNGATFYLRNPWDFAFSWLFMAGDCPNMSFRFTTPKNAKITKANHRWLAGAVQDGVRFDYDEDEAVVACRHRLRTLTVDIWTPEVLDDESYHLKLRKDAHGIYWY